MAARLKPAWQRRFDRHAQILVAVAPGLLLRVDETVDQAEIVGPLEVPRGAGVTSLVDVRITFEEINPFHLPRAYQAGSTFAPEPDRHIGEDGWFCMWLRCQQPKYFADADGLAYYLADLREFLVLQYMYDDRKRRNITPYWVGAQWDHGDLGFRQWVREHIDTVAPAARPRLFAALTRDPKPMASCPCGSRRMLRHCHGQWLRQLRAVVNEVPAAAAELAAIIAAPTAPAG